MLKTGICPLFPFLSGVLVEKCFGNTWSLSSRDWLCGTVGKPSVRGSLCPQKLRSVSVYMCLDALEEGKP